MRILLKQLNPIIGDLRNNTKKIIQAIEEAKRKNIDLILFSELTISGYPPEDFLLLPHFVEETRHCLDLIIEASSDVAVVVGLPRENPNKYEKNIYNSAAIIHNQKLIGFHDKILLPTYDVFDERRYFEPGERVFVWEFLGKRIGITICEDLWQHSELIKTTTYKRDPVLELKKQKPDLVLNLSASPYAFNKYTSRQKVCSEAAKTLNCPIFLCNQVGGNDSLIFDGYSLAVSPKGIINRAKGFQEDEIVIDLEKDLNEVRTFTKNQIEDLYSALVLGVKDYFQKIGLKKACLGLSGGIDSALVACIAADALGSENVLALLMPSQFSSEESTRDAIKLAKNLGINFKEVPIEGLFENYLNVLHPHFQNKAQDITEENIQARIRGMLLMAFANKFNYILLNTSNKSESAMGYATLYGDMCGGLAVISDLRKRQVYELAKWINRNKEIIPSYTIIREPSAELRPNQKDSDTLPDYDILDNVLASYVEDHLSAKEITGKYGYPLEIVEKLIKRIHDNEYKRRQAAPGLRISEKAFSVGRKFPIVQKWV